MNDNLFTLFRSRMPQPGKAFMEAPQGRTISYGEVIDLSGRFAQALVDLRVAPGDRVAVQVAKSPEALILYLACLRAGAVYLPLNTGYTGAELTYFLADSEPTVFVCDPAKRLELEDIAADVGVPHLETLDGDGAGSITDKAAGAAPDFADRARGKDDLAAILYTSGTTGRSKGAMLTHANLASNAETLAAYWRFSSDDVLLHALPIFHTHGLFVAANVTLMAGASMIYLPRFDIDEVLRLLPEATAMMGVPTFYSRLLSRPGFTRDLVGHIRLFVSGSAPLSPVTRRTSPPLPSPPFPSPPFPSPPFPSNDNQRTSRAGSATVALRPTRRQPGANADSRARPSDSKSPRLLSSNACSSSTMTQRKSPKISGASS